MATTKRVKNIQPVIPPKLVMKIWKAVSCKPLPSGSSHRIPPGFFTVYVGLERERFLIPTRFLNFPMIVYLLDKAGEEYGFKCNGGIVLPCEIEFFKEVLKILEKDEKKYGNLEFNEFLKVISKVGFENSSSCKKGRTWCVGKLFIRPPQHCGFESWNQSIHLNMGGRLPTDYIPLLKW